MLEEIISVITRKNLLKVTIMGIKWGRLLLLLLLIIILSHDYICLLYDCVECAGTMDSMGDH